jgi:hypothetical protein
MALAILAASGVAQAIIATGYLLIVRLSRFCFGEGEEAYAH